MAFSIYKPGQGKHTRLCTAAGVGAITLWGVGWLWNELGGLEARIGQNTIFVKSGVAVAVILGVGGLLWWVLNNPTVTDFMIATEAEMRKVNWPNRRELIGSTWVVIAGTVMMAALLFLINLGFSALFREIGILAGG
jgi:preprotein translocase subunit SecE